jgi:hypothetical protein
MGTTKSLLFHSPIGNLFVEGLTEAQMAPDPFIDFLKLLKIPQK